MPDPNLPIERQLASDDLIVIAGAGGFVAGALTRRFHNLGYTRIRAIDRKPLTEWYQRVPGVECLSMDLSEKQNAIRAVEGAVDAFRKEEIELLGMSKTRDADVLGMLVFLERVELDRNNGRPRGRAFLDLLRGLQEESSADASEASPLAFE